MSKPRIVFMGTGDIALPSFEWLLKSATPPVALITQPDRPAGRQRQLKPSALKSAAEEAGLPVLQPEKVRSPEFLDELAEMRPDLIVVMAYGQILPEKLIRMPALGCVNLHASLLPKYRGAACIQAAIDEGDAETGVTLMHVVKALDAGDVILSRRTPITETDTGGILHDRLAIVACETLQEGLPMLLDGSAPRTPQSELGVMSHVTKLDRDDGRIQWEKPAHEIQRRVRAYDPWPGSWAEIGGGKRLKIHSAAVGSGIEGHPGELREADGEVHVGCGQGSLILMEVQPEGGRRMKAGDWWRGFRGAPPERLG